MHQTALLDREAPLVMRCRWADVTFNCKEAPMETLRKNVPYRCLTFTFALVLLAMGGNVASGDSGAASFTYVIFPGSVCAPAPPCPDTARAANGDTIEIAGGGTPSVHPKSAAGGGTFTHKNPAGAGIATGTSTATAPLSFND